MGIRRGGTCRLTFDLASLERALLPAAFDPDLDFDREGHGFQPCRKAPIKSTRLSAAEGRLRLELAAREVGNDLSVSHLSQKNGSIAFDRAGRILPSAASDLFFAFDFDREGHGFSRAEKLPIKIHPALAAEGRRAPEAM